jgi:membrane fusion protein (multidrug efflux system)
MIPVRVRKVSRLERAAEVSASGAVEAAATASVSFQTSGTVQRVLADEGTRVSVGALLAVVDPADYQYGLEAAQGQLAAAQATNRRAIDGTRVQEVERARAAFDQAADEYRRMKQLYDHAALTPNDFKKIEAKYLAAKAEYDEAVEGARSEDKEAAQGAANAAAAQAREAGKRLAETRVISPLNGVVARKLVSAGDLASPGRPAFVIVDLNPAKVRAGVPEVEIGKVRVGQSATVHVPALAGREFQGRVEIVGVSADPGTRTFTVKITVPNHDMILRDGMVAEALIRTDQKVEAITVPGDAIVRDAQGARLVYVYLPEQKKVYARRVEVGTVYGTEVEISRGLAGNELIVTAGQHQVMEGSRVQAEAEQP